MIIAMLLLLLKVTPAHCFEPCTIRYSITIAAPETARTICIRLDSDSFGRFSCWPASGRTVEETTIKDVPANTYYAVAAVQRSNGLVERSPEYTINVLSSR